MPQLPQLLPLDEAAAQTGLDVATLRNLVEQGKVMAGTLPGGEIAVAVQEGKVVEKMETNGSQERSEELNSRLSRIRRDHFKHLEGEPIALPEAARRYKIHPVTLLRWAKKGYVRVLKPGRSKRAPTILNAADVAYCVAIHQIRKQFGIRGGIPLLDENGRPRLFKHALK